MRQVTALALMMILLFSAGCDLTSDEEALADDIMLTYSSAVSIDTTANITFAGNTRVYDFSVSYSGGAEDGVLEITAPELLAGTTLIIEGGETSLLANGTEFYTGAVANLPVSPATAVPLVFSEWQSGYYSECYSENTEFFEIKQEISSEIVIFSRFYKENYLPLSAEIVYNGYTIVTISFNNTVLKAA